MTVVKSVDEFESRLNDGAVLDDFDFTVSEDEVLKRCRAERGEEEGERVLELYAEAYRVGRPKILVKEVPVVDVNATTVRVGEVELVNAFVRGKLLQAPFAFAFVATCGTEVEAWSQTLSDFVDRYYVDEVKKLWIGCAIRAMEEKVRGLVAPDAKLAALNPGSLPAWPIDSQRDLFAILGDTKSAIGVELTKSCLMIPAKSVSGILFPDHTGHVNCALCPRKNCPNRRAPFRGVTV